MNPYVSRNKLIKVMLILLLTALILGANIEPDHAQNKLIIQADIGRVKIDKNIYGHFSEHLGRCFYDEECSNSFCVTAVDMPF